MRDLRTWLDEVNKIGQLMTVENVHWDLELSTLTEIINERSKTRPAIIFDRIKDYPQGYRVAANLVSSVDRLAMTLGMKPGLGDMGFVQAWREQVKKIAPVEAQPVSSGPLFENTRYPGHARQAGMIASQCRSGAYLGRYVIVVDDDVDITNSEEVLVLGFEDFLDHVEADRFNRVIKTPEMFEKFLPYAMALNVEKNWSRTFQDIYREPPSWYAGNYGPNFYSSGFVQSLNTMSSRAGSVMQSAPRSSGGSGFGGGGGGSSGGGFGGGGGRGF